MSQDQVDGVDFCDNLPIPEALTAQTQNLNETNTLTQSQSLSLLQKDDGGGHGLIPQASLSSDGKDTEKEWVNEGYTGGGREEDEEEDIDEVMKEEEEEMSEGSSSLIRCQSPDTLMTDSSYSETGSLLETPYPFSPGTSPEPPSPVCAMLSPDTAYPASEVVLSQSNVKVESHTKKTEPVASNTEPITLGPTSMMGAIYSTTMMSDTRLPCPRGSISITEVKESVAKNTNSAQDHLTSSTEPISCRGLTCATGVSSSYTASVSSNTKTFSVPSCTATLNTSVDSTAVNATAGPLNITAAPTAASAESISTTGPITSYLGQITATPVATGISPSTCATGPITNNSLLDALELLAQRGDDTHLPQYLHQIAEAFVLQEDYQRALWCIQLERLYHQRVLDNLNALQEQWENQRRGTSTDVATKQLDTLRHICQSHSRPRAKDAACVSLDVLRPTLVEGSGLPPCISARQINEGMQQRAEVSSHSQSCHPVMPSINLAVKINSPAISETDREDLHRELDERDGFDRSQPTDGHGSDREEGKAEGEVDCTDSVIWSGNELHPSKAGEMDQSKPAEQQGGDLGLVQEKEAKREEEEAESVVMEDEDEDEEEEKLTEGDSPFYQRALPVETTVSGAELEVQQLHQEAVAEEKLHEETQESANTCLHQEAHLPHEAHMKQKEWVEEEQEEELEEVQEYEYDVDQADITREAASLEQMAKLITVEEMSPASGLVSILKKRSVCVEDVGVFVSSEPRPDIRPSKRRVRFSVPNDGYDSDIGSVDSCLLLFLLCLVTVVISVGGTALYCSLGGGHSSVCQDFSRNADLYFGQIRRGISHVQHWFNPGS